MEKQTVYKGSNSIEQISDIYKYARLEKVFDRYYDCKNNLYITNDEYGMLECLYVYEDPNDAAFLAIDNQLLYNTSVVLKNNIKEAYFDVFLGMDEEECVYSQDNYLRVSIVSNENIDSYKICLMKEEYYEDEIIREYTADTIEDLLVICENIKKAYTYDNIDELDDIDVYDKSILKVDLKLLDLVNYTDNELKFTNMFVRIINLLNDINKNSDKDIVHYELRTKYSMRRLDHKYMFTLSDIRGDKLFKFEFDMEAMSYMIYDQNAVLIGGILDVDLEEMLWSIARTTFKIEDEIKNKSGLSEVIDIGVFDKAVSLVKMMDRYNGLISLSEDDDFYLEYGYDDTYDIGYDDIEDYNIDEMKFAYQMYGNKCNLEVILDEGVVLYVKCFRNINDGQVYYDLAYCKMTEYIESLGMVSEANDVIKIILSELVNKNKLVNVSLDEIINSDKYIEVDEGYNKFITDLLNESNNELVCKSSIAEYFSTNTKDFKDKLVSKVNEICEREKDKFSLRLEWRSERYKSYPIKIYQLSKESMDTIVTTFSEDHLTGNQIILRSNKTI